jgi:hypothetical protein
MYWSNDHVRRNILKQTDEDMQTQDELIADEAVNLQFAKIDPDTGAPMPAAQTAEPPKKSPPDKDTKKKKK